MDLAEQIDDFIPSVQASRSEMDSLIMLLFILLISSLFLIWLGRFLYQKYVTYKAMPSTSSTSVTSSATAVNASSTVTPATSSLLAQKLTASPLSSGGGGGGAKSSGGLFGGTPTRRGSGGNLAVTSASPGLSKTRSMSQQPNAGVRKRLTRRSPGPDLPNQRRSRSIPPPAVVTGPDETTSIWATHVFKWLYSDLVIVNDLLYGFITAINQTMARNTSEEKMLIEVVRLLPESTAPNISNIFCDKPMTSDAAVSEVVVTMDVETTLVLQVKAFRQVSGKADVLHYRVSVRFRGHLSISMNYTALVGEMRIEGYPDIKVTIASIGPIKTNGKEEKEIQDMICESINLTIRDTIYPVDFSVHATCPRAMKMEADEYYDHQSMDFPNPYDYMGGGGSGGPMQNRMHYEQTAMRDMNHSPVQMTSGRRLLVKIVKGDGLAQAKDPYCVVEMDEPPQKNQTGSRQGSTPFWDEHFLFDLSHASSEILFEVYDRPVSPNDHPKFLGLGLVGVDELAVGPSSSQVIGLQPRPYETQNVSGAITVEFVFIEGAQVPANGRRPYKLKEALKLDPHQQEQQYGYEQQQPARLSPMLQRQQFHHHQQQPQQMYMNGNDSGYMNENPNLSRTTSPSHDKNSLRPINYSSPQRHNNASVPNSSKYDNNSPTSTLLSPASKSSNNNMPITSTPNKPNTLNVKISMIQQQQNENNKETSIDPISGNLSERGRERNKTTIFGTLRKRLSRSKTRNEEATNGGNATNSTTAPINSTNGYSESHQPTAPHHQYSNSFDSNASKNLKSPTSTLNRFGISGSSRRSSTSEMSGLSRLSSISNKTFLHEASSLVLEVIENGVRRHYLVPMNVAQKPRWRKKGTKLHIYNDHTFVAKHLPSGLICEICMLSIPFRIGKQGYECRDCFLKCHKQCHVRTPRLCPKPTIQSIELSNLPVLKDF